MTDHERGFLEFLDEPTRRRMETLLQLGSKRRKDVRLLLDHSIQLKPRLIQHLTGRDASSGSIEAILRNRGAPDTCYAIAAESSLDGKVMDLAEALKRIVGMGSGAFVSCIPGRLGLFESEEMKSSFLCFK